jgi:hypothetical protein
MLGAVTVISTLNVIYSILFLATTLAIFQSKPVHRFSVKLPESGEAVRLQWGSFV